MHVVKEMFRFATTLGILLVTSCFVAAQEKPLRIFVLVGQSNMQGHAHVRTLPYLGMDPVTSEMLAEIQNENGEPKVFEDIWISSLSSDGVKTGQLTTGFGANEFKIGPELTFGIYMQKKLKEPILIIKTAWGGKSLNTDFRPPSAGPYEFGDGVIELLAEKRGDDVDAIKTDKDEATGVFYRKTIDHVKSVLEDIEKVYPDYNPANGFELAGLVWFQGWNDMVDPVTYPNRNESGGYDQYSQLLADLIRDFRKEFDAPQMPVVIGVMGVEGPTSKYPSSKQRFRDVHQNFRDAMAAPANLEEFDGNVFTVFTENYWDMELDAILERDAKIQAEVKKLQQQDKLRDAVMNRSGAGISAKEAQQLKTARKKGQLAQVWVQNRRAKEFDPREIQILNTGASDAAYHYLGSSKILAQIGKAFADAIPIGD